MIDRKELTRLLMANWADYPMINLFEFNSLIDKIMELDVEPPKSVEPVLFDSDVPKKRTVGLSEIMDEWHKAAQRYVASVPKEEVSRDTYDKHYGGIRWSNTPENNGVFGKL